MDLRPQEETTNYFKSNDTHVMMVSEDLKSIIKDFGDSCKSQTEAEKTKNTKRASKSRLNKKSELKPSEYLLRMPKISEKLISSLAEGQKKFSDTDKIYTAQDTIIYGYATSLAMQLNGVEVTENDVIEYTGDTEDIVDFMLTKHLLREHYSNFQSALIIAEFYPELVKIVDRDMEKKNLKGRNRRKEIARKFNKSEFYIAEAINLKNNYPEVFDFMKNSNKYRYNELDDIKALWKNRPDLYQALVYEELKLHEAIFDMRNSRSRLVKQIHTDEKDVQLYLNDNSQLTEQDKNDIIQIGHYRPDLYQALVKQEMGLPEALYLMRSMSARWDGNITTQKTETSESKITSRKQNAEIIDNNGDLYGDTDPDAQSNNPVGIKGVQQPDVAPIEEEEDIYADFETPSIIPALKTKSIWNSQSDNWEDDLELCEKQYEEDAQLNLERQQKTNESKIQSLALECQSDVVKSQTIIDTVIEKEENLVENLQNSSLTSCMTNSVLSPQESNVSPKLINLDSGISIFDHMNFTIDPNDSVIKEFKSSIFDFETYIPQEQLKEQDEILKSLINEGKIHQHKKVRRNIGHIIFKFDKKVSEEVKSKDVATFLEKSVRLYKVGTELLSMLQKNYDNISSEDNRKIEAFKEVIKSFESEIKSCIFYK